jgi:hypothetical protein
MFNREKQDKNIRNIIEGPPRIESAKKFESKENNLKRLSNINKKIESQSANATSTISPKIAHKIGLALLSNPEFLKNLKNLIKERLVKGEKITRLDTAIIRQEIFKEPYGLSREHLVDNFDKNFLNFEIIRDGDDVAITFRKTTGEKAIRSLDDEALAQMLNQLLQSNTYFKDLSSVLKHISMK